VGGESVVLMMMARMMDPGMEEESGFREGVVQAAVEAGQILI